MGDYVTFSVSSFDAVLGTSVVNQPLLRGWGWSYLQPTHGFILELQHSDSGMGEHWEGKYQG